MNASTNLANALAIVGIGGRFPKSGNWREFWSRLSAGEELVTFFSDEELEQAGVPEEMRRKSNFVPAASVLEGEDLFDAAFFGFNPREASITDPQLRLFLECAHETLESAGYGAEANRPRTGVFAGCSLNSYFINNVLPNPKAIEAMGILQTMFRNEKDHLPTLAAYKLSLTGPAVNVQTACSTSLVAVHMACQSVLRGECDMALAGGVSIKVPQRTGYLHQQDSIASPDGHCRAFDARGQGTLAGNGVGLALIRRLSDAIEAGDHIHAVIRGSAINNDGALKAGYTAPSVDGQAEVILEALAVSQVNPETITCVEAHGTGTSLGDPIEIEALTEAYRAFTDKKGYCAIGSVKSNLGHLDAAAGITGLLKAVLQLEHKRIAPSLHFETPNPKIDFANNPFFVNAELREWKRVGDEPRRSAVSSFGIGGTNSHVILEEAPEIQTSAPVRSKHFLTLSAKSEPALQAAARNLAIFLRENPSVSLADAAYTLHVGREGYDHRAFVVADSHEPAAKALDRGASLPVSKVPGGSPSVAFLFPGQGSQHLNMCRGLYEGEPAFREAFDRCASYLLAHEGLDLRPLVFPQSSRAREESPELTATRVAQPALFAVEYAMAQLWMEWGVEPQAMAGHSIGEYVAACLAGVFTFEEGLSLVAARGRLMDSAPRGAMVAASATPEELRELLDGDLAIAVVNGPRACVAAGPSDQVDRLEQKLRERGLSPAKLHTSHAFHSPAMDGILDAFATEVAKVKLQPPAKPFLSNLTGAWIRSEEATDPAYWVRHIRQTVLFGENLAELLKEPGRILLEVGPGQALTSPAKRAALSSDSGSVLSSAPHLKQSVEDSTQALETLGRLWQMGVAVNWEGFHRHGKRRRTPLPTYPFQRTRHWIEGESAPAVETKASPAATMGPLDDWFYAPSWKRAPLASRTHSAAGETWLLLEDVSGVGAAMASQLKNLGASVIRVRTAESFSADAEGNYAIRPGAADDYDQLFRQLQARQQEPDVIVHLWTAGGRDKSSDPDAIDPRGFPCLVLLSQEIGKRFSSKAIRLGVVADRLFDVAGGETTAPERSLLLGPARALPFELSNVDCRVIDAGELDPSEAAGLASKLVAEIQTPAKARTTFRALRGCYAWEPCYEPVPIPEDSKALLRQGGVYLITGGVGGIGLAAAEFLAREYSAKLVLTARTALPSSEQWDAYIGSHSTDDPVRRRIAKVRELIRLGAEVEVVAADVADSAAMRKAIEQAEQRFGHIDGVIHAAGVAGGGLMQLKDMASAWRVLSPKVSGTRVLGALLAERRPDFLMLCSSITSIMGGVGQSDYCAANAYLDAFAVDYQRRTGVPTVAVNWDPWKETGMAVDTVIPADLKQMREENLRFAIPTRDGIEALRRILSMDHIQVVVSTTDLPSRIELLRNPSGHVLGSAAQAGNERAAQAAVQTPRSLATPAAPPRDDLDRVLASIWQDLLGIQEVGVDDDFFELGGHSLLAIQITSRIHDTLGAQVPLASFFQATTVAKLADVMREQQATPGELEAIAEAVVAIADMSAEEVQDALEQRSVPTHGD